MPNHHKHLSSLRIHRGQAMIEYAILLLLLVMIFVGGAEIGSTALASYKTTDAAKTAISEYAEINQQRLNILNAEKQYLTTLAGYGCSVIYQITNYGTESTVTLGTDANDITCTQPTSTQVTNGVTFVTYDDYIKYLDAIYLEEEDALDGAGKQELIDFSDLFFDALKLVHIAPSSPDCTAVTGSPTDDWDDDNNCDLTIDEIKSGRVKDNLDGRNKLKYLLLQEHLKLANLPLNQDVDDDNALDTYLSDAKILLGNHGAVSSSAVCNPDGSYDYNIDNQQYFYRKYKDSNGDEQVYQVGSIVYLFQPFAIDVQSCEGVDPNRGNQSKLSVLVNGYSRPSSEISPTDPEDDFADTTQGFVPGLPKLNQAMYSLYTKVCVNAANEYISCKDFANVSRTLLKPPGKICFLDGGLNEDNCPNNPNQNEVSGYYMWGRSSASKEGYEIDNVANELATGFRPTYQLDCSPQPNLKGEVGTEFGVIHDTACDSNPSKVRVHTRYRKVFEGFVTLGLMELASTANGELGLFYNPNNVGVSNQVNSVAGSEIGPLGANQRPTVKYFRDFRGCYEVDVETNQVSACN